MHKILDTIDRPYIEWIIFFAMQIINFILYLQTIFWI